MFPKHPLKFFPHRNGDQEKMGGEGGISGDFED